MLLMIVVRMVTSCRASQRAHQVRSHVASTPERDIHSVIAATVDELKTSYGDDSAWAGLYPRDGNHVIRFYADGRNNSDGGVGGGPSHVGVTQNEQNCRMTGQTAVSAMARSGSTP